MPKNSIKEKNERKIRSDRMHSTIKKPQGLITNEHAWNGNKLLRELPPYTIKQSVKKDCQLAFVKAIQLEAQKIFEEVKQAASLLGKNQTLEIWGLMINIATCCDEIKRDVDAVQSITPWNEIGG
ncbi:MAG: hypothetical protein LBT45_03570 [Rickettsiales bacterium]|jgi:hypothetical protein|nr:hypothetical protein [Rickettsiales bacterium]